MALGELKSGKGFRSEKQAEATEQPSKKGGKAAVRSSVSAASIAKVLSGIDFLRYEKNARTEGKMSTVYRIFNGWYRHSHVGPCGPSVDK
ncbi:MAG: hypothetical protein WCF23_01475 [Candidatus Nitrosopolaris sp.]